MGKKTDGQDRRERAAHIQRQQKKDERRRSLLIIGPAVLLALLIIGSTAFVLIGRQREEARVAAQAKAPIEGVRSFKKLSRNHVNTAVAYPQNPPVGGDHASVWTNCKAYAAAVDPMKAVHSLEHGAVWISYRPNLDKNQVQKLEGVAQSNEYVLVTPTKGLKSPITMTAWGKQASVDSADDPRLATFVEKYQQGPQTPEPGAPCTGGTDGT